MKTLKDKRILRLSPAAFMPLILSIILILCVAEANLFAAVIYNDGANHLLNTTIADTIAVYDGPGSSITSITAVEPANITKGLAAFNHSVINIQGGTFGISGVALYDNCTGTVSDGLFLGALSAVNNAVIDVNGGTFNYNSSGQGLFYSGSNVNAVTDSAVIRVYGTAFNLPYGPIRANLGYTQGFITGTLANGDPINTYFYIYENSEIILIPEPASLMLVGICGLLLRGRRKK